MITRRRAIKNILSAAALSVFPIGNIKLKSSEEFDIVIKNGNVFTDNQLKKLFVGIRNKKIFLSDLPIKGYKEIDAENKIVSPGFIDILADNKVNPSATYKIFEKYKVTDGCTTVLQLHGGHENPLWFYDFFSKKKHYTNYGVGVFSMRLLNSHGASGLIKKVEEGLDNGGLGVSYSLEYQSISYSQLLALAKTAYKYNRTFFLHLRHSSREKELEGVEEAIKIALESNVHLHIDHLNSTGGTFNMEKALEKISSAIRSGAKISCCVYPYSYWATNLASKRFSGDWQKRYNLTYEDLHIVGQNKTITKENFNYYRNTQILVAVPEGTIPLENTFDIAIKEDFCVVASDGGIEKEPVANNHPRGAGCFSTAVRRGLDIGLSINDVLKKVSFKQTEILSPFLANRGIIKNNAVADITIFDKNKINGKADVKNPNRFSEGIECVIVNGEIVYQEGKLISEPGLPIKA